MTLLVLHGARIVISILPLLRPVSTHLMLTRWVVFNARTVFLGLMLNRRLIYIYSGGFFFCHATDRKKNGRRPHALFRSLT
ncbi:MAG: hypothetical protein [Cressdnaviricota sp.]|nr:MAG: hypothetical protein [Cressdnaviricota sp.]